MNPALVVLGTGRIGTMVLDLARRVGVLAVGLGREDDPEPVATPHPGRPILVATRNDDLDGVFEDVHPDNRPDLVFVQNGMIRPWLAERGLLGNTQGVLYVAVPSVGAPPQPGGTTLFWGPWASALTGLFNDGGVPAREIRDEAQFLREVGIKLAWTAVFGLLGQGPGRTVGHVAWEQEREVEALIAEITPVIGRALQVALPPRQVAQQALAYARSIPDYQATLKEWRWRNGWIVEEAARQGVALPRHSALLASLREPPKG